MAVRFFRNGYEGFEYKRAPYLWPVYRTQIPQASPISVESYVSDGYEKNATLYSAIMYVVRAANAAPLRAYRGTQDEPEPLPPGHPLVELCARPNPYQAWAEFNAAAWVYFKLLGNCFIYVDRGRRDQW